MFILFLVLNVEGFWSFSCLGCNPWLVLLGPLVFVFDVFCDELLSLSDDALTTETIDLDMRNPPPHASRLSTWRRR